MFYSMRTVDQADVEAISALVQLSFTKLAAPDWEPNARQVFLAESSPASMQSAPKPAYAVAAFDAERPVGFISLPNPAFVGLLFVHPGYLRRGVGRRLWEQARAFIEKTYPETETVETNSTPYALGFYRSVGFVPISTEFTLRGCRATRMACWLRARALGADAL